MAYDVEILGPPPPKWRVTEDDPATETADDPATLNEALDYGDRQGDRALLESFTIDRYATGLKRADNNTETTDNSGNSSYGYESYVKGKAAAAITIGNKFEIIPSGQLTRTAEEKANLFTHPRQQWIVMGENDEPNEDAEKLLLAHRDAGGFDKALTRWDKASCTVNASCLRPGWAAGHLTYEPVRATAVRIAWPSEIMEGDSSRAPNKADLEDAAAVGILLEDGTANSQPLWIVYEGRSVEYPDGRCVTFRAEAWYPLPEVGAQNIEEEWSPSLAGEPANPLTWYQNTSGEDALYEYPLCVLLGNDGGSDSQVLPTSTSLYSKWLDLDSASSRNITAASKASTGTVVIENTGSAPLPDALDGAVALKIGQTASRLDGNANNSKLAGEVIDNYKREVIEAEGIPSYLIMAGSGGAPESGAALAVRHAPALDARRKRVKLNRDAVRKLTSLELSLISMHGQGSTSLAGVDVRWEPGEWEPPIPRELKAESLEKAKALGVIDQIEAVRDYHGLETREQAKELLDSYKADEVEYGTGNKPVDKVIAGLKPRAKPPVVEPEPPTPEEEPID